VLGHHPLRVIHASGSTARSPPCRAARSYVIRVIDGTTGVSKPKWVGGFATEADAKAARDEARRSARRGEYVDRSGITVSDYLHDWLDARAMETKPRALANYRWLVRQYVDPRIGHL
jgi:hypothetical protein